MSHPFARNGETCPNLDGNDCTFAACVDGDCIQTFPVDNGTEVSILLFPFLQRTFYYVHGLLNLINFTDHMFLV